MLLLLAVFHITNIGTKIYHIKFKIMKKHLFLTALLLVFHFLCNAQKIIFDDTTKYDGKWMIKGDFLLLKSMKVVYNRPLHFYEVKGAECFKKYPKLENILACAFNQLHSNDEQFIVFIHVEFFTKKDSIDMKRSFPNMKFDVIDKMPNKKTKYDIRMSFGDEAAANWREYVDFYPTDKAKSIFNADTVMKYSIKLQPQDFYLEKYKNLDVLVLQKKGGGYITLYCFYTEEGKKELPLYWKEIEGVFRYKD